MILDLTNDVKAIKTAILKSRYIAARLANGEMLKLYFAIGGYVSRNSRNGRWGTGVIDEISRLLQKELPGLRGFSAQNMRNMRLFYEEWNELAICQTVSSKLDQAVSDRIPAIMASEMVAKRQPLADNFQLSSSRKSDIPVDKADIEICQSLTGKLEPDDSHALHLSSSGNLNIPADKADIEFCQPAASKLGPDDSKAFMSVGFSHHMAIIRACKSLDERLFYIRNSASGFWSYRSLQQHLKANDFATQGRMINNFALTMPDDKQVSRAVQAFKSEYLLDFVNIVDAADDEETLDEPEWMMEMVLKIRHFIQTLGPDFCFMDVKKRFIVEGKEYFADLVFFHRVLKCMVAVELKRGIFKPSYLGQLEFYLACLDKYVKYEDENPSIGLLICHEMSRSVVELTIGRHNSPLGVATYRTAEDVPDAYKTLRPLLDGAQKLFDDKSSDR